MQTHFRCVRKERGFPEAAGEAVLEDGRFAFRPAHGDGGGAPAVGAAEAPPGAFEALVAAYRAHRSHPRLPMLQLRFAGAAAPAVAEVTLSFDSTEARDAFIAALLQRWGEAKAAASAAAGGAAVAVSAARAPTVPAAAGLAAAAAAPALVVDAAAASRASAAGAPASPSILGSHAIAYGGEEAGGEAGGEAGAAAAGGVVGSALQRGGAAASGAAAAPGAASGAASGSEAAGTADAALVALGVADAPGAASAAAAEAVRFENPALAAAYDYLVVERQCLTHAEFWERHATELRLASAQTPGLTAADGFLAAPLEVDGAAAAGAAAGEAANATALTKALRQAEPQLRQILAEFPAVARAYVEQVPGKISKNEFWTRFLQSKEYHEIVGRAAPANADTVLLAAAVARDAPPPPAVPRDVQNLVERGVDLVADDLFDKPGLGTFSAEAAPGRPLRKKRLFDRFNKHALQIIQSLESTPETRSPRTAPEPRGERRAFARRAERLLEDVLMPDLLSDRAGPGPAVTAARHSSAARSGAADGVKTCALREAQVARLAALAASAPGGSPGDAGDAGNALSLDQARAFFLLCTKGIQAELQARNVRSLEGDFSAGDQVRSLLDQAANRQMKTKELLYQFWNTPLRQKARIRKLTRVLQESLESLSASMEHLSAQSDLQLRALNPRALFLPLIDAVKRALDFAGVALRAPITRGSEIDLT